MLSKYLLINLLAILFSIQSLFCQYKTIHGKVVDGNGLGLFAVNVYLQQNKQTGTVSDFNGSFSLNFKQEICSDTIVFSSIGYCKKQISINNLKKSDSITVTLNELSISLNNVNIIAKSISEEFSVVQMKKLNIYLNPSAGADPLKAISNLPVSTNMDETANPVLRGSNANRTMVYLNGVPVNNPVKNSQLNGIGFFSLFNTAIIKNLNVYASNTPLIYGNSSAGIIEIETDEKFEQNGLQTSISLASAGLLLSNKVFKNGFLQLYGNYQFSNAFLLINKESSEKLKSFGSKDLGVNFHFDLSKKSSINIYSYLINESSQVKIQIFTHKDLSRAQRFRNFNILNFRYLSGKHLLTINLGEDFSNSKFEFGNIHSQSTENQLYSALNYKNFTSANFSFQAGITNIYQNHVSKDKIPLYYFALSPASPTLNQDTRLKLNIPEMYIYAKWKITNPLTIGIGARKNLKCNSSNYTSFQSNLHYEIDNHNSVIFAMGKYHSYTNPDYKIQSANLLKSNQFHLEYNYQGKLGLLQLAAYYKIESGENHIKSNIKGFEFYLEKEFLKYFKVDLSNTILNSDLEFDQSTYNTSNKYIDFLKTTFSYSNYKILSISLSYIYHPGKFFIPVINSVYYPGMDTFEPVYDKNTNSGQLNAYRSMNLSLNKMILVKKSSIILFASAFNLLNQKNQNYVEYNKNYTNFTYNYYQSRSIYFGMVLNMNYK